MWRKILHRIVDTHGVDQLAGIHAVVRIPQRLELAEGLHQLRAEHLGQQHRARLPVAVLATERSAEMDDEVGGAFNKLAELSYPLWAREIEVDAHVHAALAVVAIERAAIAEFVHQFGERAQVVAEFGGRNGRILPALPAVRLAGHKNHRAQRRFAHVPHAGRFLRRADVRRRRIGPRLRRARKHFGLGARLLGGPCAHLDQQEANSGRKLVQLLQRQALAAHEFDQKMVETLEADGLVLQRTGNGVGGLECIGESQHREHAMGRARRQVEVCGEHVDAGAFRADQRAGHVEAALRQQFVQVVAGDAPRNAREPLADQHRVVVADALEAGVDLPLAAARADDGFELVVAGAPHGHARAVVEHNVERFHVVHDLAAQQPVHAAGVVADHAAEGAARVGCGIGRVGQVMLFGGLAQAIEDDAGIDGGELAFGVERAEPVHVLRVIENDGDIGALAGQAGASAAGQHGGAEGAAGRERSLHVGGVARQHNADGELAIVGGIGGVERARAHVEADFAADHGLEAGFQFEVRGETLVFERRRIC